MSADEVAAAALAADGPPGDATATHHTAPMRPEDIAAAAELAAARDSAPPPPSAPEREPDPRSAVGALGALLGLGLGVVALLSLAWTSAPGGDPSWWDLRDAVDTTGLDIGPIAMAFVLSGVPFAVGVGTVVTLARAIGTRGARATAAVVVVLAAAGLAVFGFAAIDVQAPSAGTTTEIGPEAGAPVTLPDGTPVTDPTTGEPLTVGEADAGIEGLSDDEIAGATIALGEDRLGDAAVVGAAILAGAALVLLVGLALRGMPGRIVTAIGLLVVAGWAIAATLQLRSNDVDPGLGLHATIVGAVIFAIATAIPGRPARSTP
jgi:Ca2+/Na+ antiporter